MIAQLTWEYVQARPWKAANRLISYAAFEGRPVTTRGRWINPFVFAVLGGGKRLPALRPVRNPVFVVGTGRSGTSILGLVLSMHRDVGFLNEPKALWHAVHPHEDLIGSYSRGQARYWLTSADATPEMRRVARRIYSAFLLLSGSRRVVDKYPELIFRVPFVQALFPDARFLFLVRDGWDTCQSIEGWSARRGRVRGGERHDWWGVDDRKWHLLVDQVALGDPVLRDAVPHLRKTTEHRVRAAVEWTLTMRAGLEILRLQPESMRLVRYEELTRRPRETLPQVLSFCDLRPDPVLIEYATRVLHSTPPREKYVLPHWLGPAFEKTMTQLGYSR